jgi:hypothetical protein
VAGDEDDALREQWLVEQRASEPSADEAALVDQWRTELDDQARLQEQEVRQFLGTGTVLRHRPAPRSGRRGPGRARRDWDQVDDEYEDFYFGPYLQLISQRVRDAGLDRDQIRVIAERWSAVTNGIGEAHAWWTAGISPLDERFEALIEMGLRPADLALVVDGRTVLQHLRTGMQTNWLARHPDLQKVMAEGKRSRTARPLSRWRRRLEGNGTMSDAS